ncbi:hypothetical protein AHMF7605_29095 [Adhaeribacter arboris]|uniref:STAS/SEC14 domain-containing protein n=1 Tax=Adhaeribacter arboris TaxID=2072846 RepID=A0A2T2Y8Y4_9BACT|nr:hypothetical protein [Adhaeribacter arboris]PSR51967.1 hypothetical protein AHMF7605_29095 [Adhaeribacter arboris]
MILFDNGHFLLDYDSSTDTLFVTLPDMQTPALSQAELCFEIMVDHVRNYNIHHLLLDSSQAVVEVAEPEYHDLIYRVSLQLQKTNLRKVARLVSATTPLEAMARRVQQDVLSSEAPTYLIQNFTDREQALTWLTGKPFRTTIR